MRQTANAFPTCEGALQLAMEQTAFTLQNARCLVIGAGRIGMLLARKLYALDAQVTVSARCTRDFARIAAAGLHALDTRRLAGHLAGFDLIFNTVPAPILTTEVLSDMKPPCFIIDLASLPGGVSADTLLPDGCRVLHALSLPGKVAPLSAARAVFDTVDTILHEEGILWLCTDRFVLYLFQGHAGYTSTHRARRHGHADSVRQRRYTRHPLWHSRALARGTDRTHRHLPYRQHCFRRADWTEGSV